MSCTFTWQQLTKKISFDYRFIVTRVLFSHFLNYFLYCTFHIVFRMTESNMRSVGNNSENTKSNCLVIIESNYKMRSPNNRQNRTCLVVGPVDLFALLWWAMHGCMCHILILSGSTKKKNWENKKKRKKGKIVKK